MSSASVRNWSVLILCTGYGNELLRSDVKAIVSDLGFNVTVYDSEGYPVDPGLHSHQACLLALDQHDIVLAFAGDREGGTFACTECPAEYLDWLKDHDVFDANADWVVPTIFQIEVLTAKALNKPVLIFIPKDVESKVGQTIETLRQGGLRLKKRRNVKRAPKPGRLIEKKAWPELASYYEVPSGHIPTFRHVAFLERLRKEPPNYVSFYDPAERDKLAALIQSRLSSSVMHFVREHRKTVQDLVERKRNPVGEVSLQDLLNRGLILDSPYEVISGSSSRKRLVRTSDGGSGLLADLLSKKKTVLLLGNPGLGKTTTSLLSYPDILTSSSNIPALVSMYASWKDLPPPPLHADDLIRAIISLPRNRPPWPKRLQLPNVHWLLVLDGFDEYQSDKQAVLKTITDLPTSASVLVTCREYDYERYLRRCNFTFSVIIRLVPWDADKIKSYVVALKGAGRDRAAAFIKRELSDGSLPSFLSLPLWLTMLTYLAESESGTNVDTLPRPQNDYELVRLCVYRVAEEEMKRHDAGPNINQLCNLWSQTAWLLHKTVKDRQPLHAETLINQLEPKPNAKLMEAVLSCLEIRAEVVKGFFHEVFREYWLAEHIVDTISRTDNDKKILELLGYQRSVVTNKFARLRIQSQERVQEISDRLRRAFFSKADSRRSTEFAKNQILYLLGRIDPSPENRQFLASIWNGKTESRFIRYAAAWAEARLGNKAVEAAYYGSLSKLGDWDQINRGYHLYYYGDIDIDEGQVPPKDDGTSPAESTLRTLFRRLQRPQPENLNLRRIELFTVRRFLETHRQPPRDVDDPKAIVRSAARSANRHPFGPRFAQSVKEEAGSVIRLLSRRVIKSRRPSGRSAKRTRRNAY
jgi:DNA polymerase III delta prime subunit